MKVCAEGNSDTPVAVEGSRLSHLLGEVRREKNGAVADFMRFYGDKYGLNYGVSIPTIRSIARLEIERCDVQVNHKFAKQLYQQEVRELRLIALWLANADQIESVEDLAFWGRGIINSEVAEEAAFALLYRTDLTDEWLMSDVTLLQYCAVMALAKRGEASREMMQNIIHKHQERLIQLAEIEPHITPKAIVALLDTAIKCNIEITIINTLLRALSESAPATKYIRDEIAWRVELG